MVYNYQAKALKAVPSLAKRLPEVQSAAYESAKNGVQNMKRQATQTCTLSYLALINTLNSSACVDFQVTAEAMGNVNVNNTQFAANVQAFCQPNQCLPSLRLAFFNLSISCGVDLSVYAAGVFDFIAISRLICLQDSNNNYCLPAVRAASLALDAIPAGTPLTSTVLDSVCTECFTKFLAAAGILSGNGASLKSIYDLGLLCLKGTTAAGASVYCALEVQTFANGFASPTTQTLATTLNAACRTRCLAKYYIASQSITNPDLAAATNTSAIFSFICSQNPDKNNAYCLTLFDMPATNPCTTILTGCSTECKAFISGTITNAGCCFTNALKLVLFQAGSLSAFDVAKGIIASNCQVTIPALCAATTWDTVTVDLVIRNIRAAHWIANRAAYLDAIKQDICQYFGCDVATVTVTVDVTVSASSTVNITVTWTDPDGNLVIKNANFQNIVLGNTNQLAGTTGTSDMSEPVAIQSGDAKSSSPNQTDTSSAVANSTPAIVLALFSVILAIMSLF